jgi:hypothetical protein
MIAEALLMIVLQDASPDDFRPVRKIDPYALCSCKAVDEASLVRFTGYAADAELTLSEDTLKANDRQATIFRVVKGVSEDVAEMTKVYHRTNPSKCGVSFDYGKRYDVVAVKKDGVLETDWCVLGKPRKAE